MASLYRDIFSNISEGTAFLQFDVTKRQTLGTLWPRKLVTQTLCRMSARREREFKSTSADIFVVFALLQFTNPSYCSINQSEGYIYGQTTL